MGLILERTVKKKEEQCGAAPIPIPFPFLHHSQVTNSREVIKTSAKMAPLGKTIPLLENKRIAYLEAGDEKYATKKLFQEASLYSFLSYPLEQ